MRWYDGIQFDLNPEGIGVQPMIASCTIKYRFNWWTFIIWSIK